MLLNGIKIEYRKTNKLIKKHEQSNNKENQLDEYYQNENWKKTSKCTCENMHKIDLNHFTKIMSRLQAPNKPETSGFNQRLKYF